MSPDASKYYQHGLNVWFKSNYLSNRGFPIWYLVFFVLEKYIVCDVFGLRFPSFESSSVLYITLTNASSVQDLILPGMQQKYINLVLDVIRTVGTSNQTIFYNLQNICFSSSIDLDTLTIMYLKVDFPYLWLRPLCLVLLNLAYGLL